MVGRTEQQYHMAGTLAQRAQQTLHSIPHIVQRRIGPHAGAVEQVARNDRQVWPFLTGRLHDLVHAAQRVLTAQVDTVLLRPGQAAQMDVARM